MEKVIIKTDKIQLDQFLKWAGIIESGGQIRSMLENNMIYVNGKINIAKRKQLFPNDLVKIEGVGEYRVYKE